MAEYKALAQNTLKVITETTINYNGSIGLANVSNLPRIKHLNESKSSITYYSLIPANKSSQNEHDTGFANILIQTAAASSSSAAKPAAYEKAVTDFWFSAAPTKSCYIDGILYHGVKSAYYIPNGLCQVGAGTASGSSYTTVNFDAKGSFPAVKMKLVTYSSAAENVTVNEINVPALEIPQKSQKVSGYTGVCYFPCLCVRKGADDIVLAIELEYPKYDITIRNSNNINLQYSLDNGLTYADVTDNLTLTQIEHILFKNNSEAAVNIGTTEGDVDIASVSTSLSRVVIPTANEVWHIS